MRSRRACWIALAFALGCALPRVPGLPSAPPATLAVEFTQGFAQAPEPPAAAGPERVEILLDATSSMQTPTAAGPERLVAAKGAVARLIRSLPEQTAIGLHAFGAVAEGQCGSGAPLARSEPGQPRDELARRIEALTPKCEGSLAASLADLRALLASEGATARARVVAVTDLGAGDLGEQGAADLCAAVSALVSGEGRLDLVVLGEAPVPECVTREVTGSSRVARGAMAPPPPSFRVEVQGAWGGEARVVARGLADGRPSEVPAGLAVVVVELDPPSRIGPLMLSPEMLTEVRVLDFPTLESPSREWVWTAGPLEPAAGATPEPQTP
jgi:hypothetical protein